MKFNTEKSKFQVLNFDKKDKEKQTGYVKMGKIEECDDYTYLGEIVNKKGTVTDTVKKKEDKIKFLKTLVKTKAVKAGRKYCEVALKFYEVIIMSVLLQDTETWSIISSAEMSRMEKIQKDTLYYLFDLRSTTPYAALLSELGLRKVEYEIEIQKLMFLH